MEDETRAIAAVTGARGMVGRVIVQELLKKGWLVNVLTRSGFSCSDRRVKVIECDICDEDGLRALVVGVEAVFHCAAELNDESKMYSVNVGGTQNLLNLVATLSRVRYFCYISSAGVVGPTSIPIVDEKTVCNPFSEYEKTKYEAEKLVIGANLNMSVCVLRPTNVVDEFKPGILVLPIHNSWKDRVLYFLKGREGAHVVHSKDVADAALFFLEKPGLGSQIFFISCDGDERNTVAGVYSLYMKICKKEKYLPPIILPRVVPYLIRKLVTGNSLHGRVRFSPGRVEGAGFVFGLGLEGCLTEVCNRRNANS